MPRLEVSAAGVIVGVNSAAEQLPGGICEGERLQRLLAGADEAALGLALSDRGAGQVEGARLVAYVAPLSGERRSVFLVPAWRDRPELALAHGSAMPAVACDVNGIIVFVNRAAEDLFGYRVAELLGSTVEVLVPERSRGRHPKLRDRYRSSGSAMAVRVLAARRKDGTSFPVEIRLGSAETSHGILHHVSFIDVTAREALLASQVARQTALADLGRIGLTASIQEVIDAAVGVVEGCLGVDVAFYAELARDGDTVQTRASSGQGEALSSYPAGRGTFAGSVLERSEPVLLEDLRGGRSFDPNGPGSVALRDGVCLRVESGDGRVRGMLVAGAHSRRRFVADDVAFLRTVASIVSSALELAEHAPLFELSIDPLAVADAAGHLVRVNAAWERVLGWTPAELCARPYLDFAHPHDREAAAEMMGLLGEPNAIVEAFECRIRTAHDDYRTLLLSGRTSADGRWIYAAAKDITVLKQREAQLADMAAQTELILGSAGEGILRVNRACTIVYANPAAAGLLGGEPGWLVGRSLREVMRLSHQNESRHVDNWCPAEQAMSANQVIRVDDEVFRRADGSSCPVEYTAAPVVESGEVTGAVVVFTDVTARKELEHAAALRQAAEVANAAKSEFLSRMSHELRTPLNAILGFGQLLERSDLDERQHRHVEYVIKGGRHLLRLIDEILEISRLESGTLPVSIEPVMIGDAVNESLQMIEPLANERSISLTADLGVFASCYVRADLQRFKQILLNLLSNAVKYNHPHGAVSVTAHSDGEMLALRVADTGPGIAAEYLPRVFSPFDRLGAESSGVEGTGLGLALSRRFAEAMGGSLDVTSPAASGAIFELRLARSDGQDGTEQRSRDVTSEPETPECRILYVEDNASNVRLLEEVLAGAGTEVTSVASGRLALDVAAGVRPDVIVLDLNLPDMSGEEVLKALRASPQTESTPVIILTADATSATRERMLDLGADSHLSKPIDVELLRSTLASAVLSQPGSSRG